MGDRSRFNRFAGLIAERHGREMRIADVAGGLGYLQLALRERGFKSVVTYDKRYKRIYKNRTPPSYIWDYRYGFFNSSVNDPYDLVVGMHPDGGTDEIIAGAIARHCPFMVCPCCVIPSAYAYFGPKKERVWVKHLRGLAERAGYKTELEWLPMSGRNLVIVGTPK